MTSWFVAPCLGTPLGETGLFGEVNDRYPSRDHTSDGTVGDPSHAARASDHNPCWVCSPPDTGIVRAADIDTNGEPGEVTELARDLLRATIGDPRSWYVIFNRVIYSRTYGWAPKLYTGSNPHDHHVHVSLQHDHNVYRDLDRWLDEAKPVTALPGVRLHKVVDAARHPRREWAPGNVRRVQRALVVNAPRSAGLRVDGIYGPATRDAMQRFSGRREPDRANLTRLGKGRFRLIA